MVSLERLVVVLGECLMGIFYRLIIASIHTCIPRSLIFTAMPMSQPCYLGSVMSASELYTSPRKDGFHRESCLTITRNHRPDSEDLRWWVSSRCNCLAVPFQSHKVD